MDDDTQKKRERLDATGNQMKHIFKKKIDNDGAFACIVHCRSLFFLFPYLPSYNICNMYNGSDFFFVSSGVHTKKNP
jgi:hypothetical protein